MSKLKEKDEFGNRMKGYEAVETSRRLDPRLPVYARIDGRSFSNFTKGMARPYDVNMISAMIETTKYLVEQTNARIGYTQSDEISLVMMATENPNSSILFDGKIQKLVSTLASMAAAKFATECPIGFEDRLPHFDCRVMQLPSETEAANMILWRAMDARKNSISMLAQHYFSHKQLFKKNRKAMLEMLAEIDVDFEQHIPAFKDGTFIRREIVSVTIEQQDGCNQYPLNTPDIWYRTKTVIMDMPPFNNVKNRVDVIFNGATPEL